MNRNVFKLGMIAVLLTIATVSVNAQWFMGGEVGFNVSNDNIDEAYNEAYNEAYSASNRTNIGFRIAPAGGYYFNEKFALGLSFRVGGDFSKSWEKSEYLDTKNRENSFNWGIFPLVRYSVFTYKKFSVLLEGSTGVGCTHGFSKGGEGTIERERVRTTISVVVFNVRPIFCFKFNDHLQMETGLRFLNLGYNIDILKEEWKSIEVPSNYGLYKINRTKHNFGVGFNSGNVLSLSQLTIGVIYKF